MYGEFQAHLNRALEEIRASGLYKAERRIASPQRPHITVDDGRELINLCANNYLGLADHPQIVQAAREALDRWGYGMASVRFICGTQTLHKTLEGRLSAFLGMEDTILYSSCFDANGGLFETLLGAKDAVISDQLNHASIIDGIRLCKARRLRYRNGDMADLAQQLEAARDARFRLIATDGVFSMEGHIADLQAICELAERHQALVMVDDSHGVGVLGDQAWGTPEHCGVMGRVDIVTGTLGKALGGASGGYTSARREIVEMLRQRSRPNLFSNALAPPIVAASIQALELVEAHPELLARLRANTRRFRAGMTAAGFELVAGEHPITPVMIGDALTATRMAERLLDEGIYVIAFSYPVVPRGQARIRVQLSAAHRPGDIDTAVQAFAKVRREMGL